MGGDDAARAGVVNNRVVMEAWLGGGGTLCSGRIIPILCHVIWLMLAGWASETNLKDLARVALVGSVLLQYGHLSCKDPLNGGRGTPVDELYRNTFKV